MVNSPLREQPREQRAAVIPSKHKSSLLDWLESSGRLIARDNQEPVIGFDDPGIADELIPGDDVVDDIYDDEDDIGVDPNDL